MLVNMMLRNLMLHSQLSLLLKGFFMNKETWLDFLPEALAYCGLALKELFKDKKFLLSYIVTMALLAIIVAVTSTGYPAEIPLTPSSPRQGVSLSCAEPFFRR